MIREAAHKLSTADESCHKHIEEMGKLQEQLDSIKNNQMTFQNAKNDHGGRKGGHGRRDQYPYGQQNGRQAPPDAARVVVMGAAFGNVFTLRVRFMESLFLRAIPSNNPSYNSQLQCFLWLRCTMCRFIQLGKNAMALPTCITLITMLII